MSTLKATENKISTVMRYLKILGRYKGYRKEYIENDIDIRGAVERYLYLAIMIEKRLNLG